MSEANKTPSPKAEGNVEISAGKPKPRKLTRQQKWRLKHPRAYLAHLYLGNALRLGLIERGPCEVCGAEPAEGHHPDYRDPSRVQWLCRRHHKALHAREVR